MKPESPFRAKVGELYEGIDRADVHRACGAHHNERDEACCAVGLPAPLHRVEAHRAARVAGNQPQGVGAQACELKGRGNATMRGLRGIGDETIGRREAGLADVIAETMVSRDQEAEKVGDRRSRDEQTRRGLGKAQGLGHPQRHLPLDVDPDMVASAAIRVEARGEHFRNHSDRRARAVHPSHEARVAVPRRVGLDVLVEILQHRFEWSAKPGQGRPERRAHVVGRRRPCRALANRLDMVDHAVEGTVRRRAKALPVLGIKARRRGSRLIHVAPRMVAASGLALRKRLATNAHFSNSASMSAANGE